MRISPLLLGFTAISFGTFPLQANQADHGSSGGGSAQTRPVEKSAEKSLTHELETPVQLALLTPIQVANSETSVNGFRLNLLYGENKDVHGVDWGFVNHTTGSFSGFEFGVVNLVKKDAKGAQFGFFNNVDGDFKGYQGAFLASSTAGSFTGLQTGWFNATTIGNFTGLQGSFLCSISEGSFSGLQYSLINITKQDFVGVQFGLFNTCDTLKGVQIGLINIVLKGSPVVSPLINIGF
jgi:hypothetical protein